MAPGRAGPAIREPAQGRRLALDAGCPRRGGGTVRPSCQESGRA
jgi:hypothetical protein